VLFRSTGSPPWSGPDLRAVLEAAWDCRPTPPPPSAPPELVAIRARAMAVEPAQRYQSALEFRDALGGFLRHRGSVQLAKAAGARLRTLVETLSQPAGATDEIYPLLSECRFGFTQALREWPENEAARKGLHACLEATARFELGRGNLAAARALLAELEQVPAELHDALVALERREAQQQQQQARLEHLSQEMDPKVALRQRFLLIIATVVGIAVVVFLPELFPSIHAAAAAYGPWYLTLMMVIVMSVFGLSLWLGRASLLSTRLNRRLMGLVAVAGLGTLFQRALFAWYGVDQRQTVMQNFIYVTMVCVLGGITLFSGFFWSAAAMVIGMIVAAIFPGREGALFGGAAAGALGAAVLAWSRWRGEFALRRDEQDR
jgi:hypothetical protein